MKKSIGLLSISLMAVLLSSCGNNSSGGNTSGPNGDRGNTTEIKIFAGGSSQYAWRKGEMEAEIYKAIEDRYYEDTGINLKFNVQFFGQTMKNAITTGITDGSIDVVISHMGGGDGIDDWILQNGLYRDLIDDYDNYEYLGKYLNWSDGEGLDINAKARVLTKRMEIIGFPSVINPYKYGILVRKDWMEAVGFSDVPKEGYELVDNFASFEKMAKAMKEKYNLPHAISGSIYELEAAGLLGAYGVPAGYYSMSEGKYQGVDIVELGGLHDPNYSYVLDTQSRWIKTGLLPPSPDSKKIDDHEADFYAQKTGIFYENPTVTHLIEVARKTKEINPDAEFTVLQALTKDSDEASTAKGFMRMSLGTFGAVITKNTPDANKILGFLNWVYSSKDNYELARYGVKGKHFFINEAGEYYYPEGFSYVNKPYSGILTLVENQVISDLQYAGFTEEEKVWINTAKIKDNYIVNDKLDYLLFNQNKVNLNLHFANRKDMSTMTQNIWSGSYTFDYDHVHGNDGGFNVCKIYNHEDRMNKVNTYLSTTLAHSQEMHELYESLLRITDYL